MKKGKIRKISSLLIAVIIAVIIVPLGITEPVEASIYYYFKSPEENTVFKNGDEIPVSFYCAPEIKTTYTSGHVTYEDMPVTLKVFKGSTEIYSKDFTYQYADTLETTYTADTYGTLELRLYGLPYGLGNTEVVEQDSLTIKVKKPKASDVKKITPDLTVERTAKKKAVITCNNSSVYGMKIYRATKKKGKYKLIKTTKKAVFTDKKLKASKVYYYKIRLYAKSGNKTYKSKWSSIKKTPKKAAPKEPVDRPVIVSVKKIGEGTGKTRLVRISWKRLGSYTRDTVDFFVCRKEPGEEVYTKLEANVTWSDNEIYLTDETAESGKTYLYNVYADSKVKNYMCDTKTPAKYTVP